MFGLRTIEELLRSMRQMLAEGGDGAASIELAVDYRLAADDEPRSEALRVVRASDSRATGRPPNVTLQQALERHPVLRHDLDTGRLWLREGSWDVDGDLVVPAGFDLRARGSVTLRFRGGAVLVTSGPLDFAGEADAKIVLEPHGDQPWGGIVVMSAPDLSTWRHVVVRGASAIGRGGWQTTGGVTFYRSPVRIEDSSFVDARGEDALNVFGCPCDLVRTRFEGGVSDLFDGDFVTGSAVDCSFADSVEDAVDVSGSGFDVTRCRFERIGDKAVSVGEGSRSRVSDCTIVSCSIGVAAKDESVVEVEQLRVELAEQFALTAYIKKPEFGPSSIVARGLDVAQFGRAVALAQTRCEVTIDGEAVPVEDVDVDRLYRERVLGK